MVRFKVVGEDAYFLAWTTTPWTLPSNVALCVNPEDTYCKVKAADGYTYYMAEALLDKVLGRLGTPAEKGKDGEPDTPEVKAYEVLETYKGSELERKGMSRCTPAQKKWRTDSTRRDFRDLRHLRYDVRRYRNRSHRSCIW